MPMQSKNPANNEVLQEFVTLNFDAAYEQAMATKRAQQEWRKASVSERGSFSKKLASVLRENNEKYARLMSLEMGKPIKQARAEIEKCAWLCEYYSENAAAFLDSEAIETDALKSYVRFDPLGVLLCIMPWNFPFWQVIRCAIPALMVGNGVLLKHASNVPQCAMALHDAFKKAGFPENIFQTLLIDGPTASQLITTDAVDCISLTGSTQAGSRVAEVAGKYLKKCVLELGGSDPYIIFEDADLDAACNTAIMARMQNAGQSCIAAKRFMIHASRLSEFALKMTELFKTIIMGDPLEEKTTLGPLANEQFAEQVEKQVNDSVTMGARILFGGKRKGAFFEPTLLSNVTKEMPVWKEETFGPVMAFIGFSTDEEAVSMANASEYGLGSSIWTKNLDHAQAIAGKIESGFVAINGMTKSDPRLPFGGIKQSGFGREMGEFGIKEFVNVKTVVINV